MTSFKPFMGAVVLACAAMASAQAQAPDNTKMNANPVNSTDASSVADGQKINATDQDLTRRIRRSVMRDKHLSTYAHNVKIVTVNGSVTLNGVVRSDREKSAIAAKAQAIAGESNVTNDLTVAPQS